MMQTVHRRVGVFGGSFDPIHLGHLNLAIEMQEIHRLDEVWLCPSGINANKLQGSKCSPEDRLAMVKLAIEGIPRLQSLDIEVFREGPSYTIDTLRRLNEMKNSPSMPTQFFLIMGADAAQTFFQWREPDEIVKIARLLVGVRHAMARQEFLGSREVVDAIYQGLTKTRIMEISSTEIRTRLMARLYCGHLLPGKVLDSILSNELYSEGV